MCVAGLGYTSRASRSWAFIVRMCDLAATSSAAVDGTVSARILNARRPSSVRAKCNVSLATAGTRPEVSCLETSATMRAESCAGVGVVVQLGVFLPRHLVSGGASWGSVHRVVVVFSRYSWGGWLWIEYIPQDSRDGRNAMPWAERSDGRERRESRIHGMRVRRYKHVSAITKSIARFCIFDTGRSSIPPSSRHSPRCSRMPARPGKPRSESVPEARGRGSFPDFFRTAHPVTHIRTLKVRCVV